MAKDLENFITITDGNAALAKQLLSEGKTVVMAVDKGQKAQQSIDEGYSGFFDSRVSLKAEAPNCGTCACGMTANCFVYLWRE